MRTARVRPLLDWCGRRERNLWLAVGSASALLYLLTATWSSAQISDAYGAAWAGWTLVHHGTFDLTSAAGFHASPDSYITVGDEVRAARMPGVLLVAVPFHALLGWSGAAATTTGTLCAALLTAAAVANVAVVLARLVPLPSALAGAATLGFGTALWTVAADQLWSHGPDALWLSCALLALSRRSPWAFGACLGLAVATRPHLAVVAACVGTAWAVHDRSVARLLQVGLPSAAGLAFVVWWNSWYHGTGSVAGGYGYAAPNLARPPAESGGDYLEAVLGTLVSPACGLLLYSPVVLLALLALRRHRRVAPWWASAAAAGGCLYLAVQLRISPHFVGGGGGFFGNRYAVEALVLATPLAVCVLHAWCTGSVPRRVLTAAAAALGVAQHAYAEVLTYALVGEGSADAWTTWYPLLMARFAGSTGVLTAVTCLLLVVLAAVVAGRPAGAVSAVPAQRPSPPAERADPSSARPAPRPGAGASAPR
jgi:hypothetical protein